MDTKEIQKMQEEHDKHHWQRNESKLEKVRHITLHMGKLLGKLATYCEQQEHGINHPDSQIRNEVIPDLQVYAAQLANLLEIPDIGESYIKRLEELKRKIGQYK